MKRTAPLWRAAVAAMALATAMPSLAQTTVNLREADIRAFIDDVARVTGATFVIDPRVQGKVSVVSEKPLGRSQYFELFLATLRANGYVAVPAGTGQYRIQPAEAGAGAAGARFSTAVIPLTNIDAQQAVDSLRPVLSRNGSASANRAGNAVIVTDFADNIGRARQVLRDVDRDRSTTQVVQLRNAGARDLATSLQQLVHHRQRLAQVVEEVADAQAHGARHRRHIDTGQRPCDGAVDDVVEGVHLAVELLPRVVGDGRLRRGGQGGIGHRVVRALAVDGREIVLRTGRSRIPTRPELGRLPGSPLSQNRFRRPRRRLRVRSAPAGRSDSGPPGSAGPIRRWRWLSLPRWRRQLRAAQGRAGFPPGRGAHCR